MIHHHIDLGSVLRGTVCELYSNLVTRPTGAAVRSEIERAMAALGGRTVTVIDFSHVTLLDFSCADEIVAKLMLRHVAEVAEAIDATPEGYFIFRGICDRHLDAIEAVLERHGLAIVAQVDGAAQLIGEVAPEERDAWEWLRALGRADARALADASGMPPESAAAALAGLARRRLAVRLEDGFVAVGVRVDPLPGRAA